VCGAEWLPAGSNCACLVQVVVAVLHTALVPALTDGDYNDDVDDDGDSNSIKLLIYSRAASYRGSLNMNST
jgi:hypothetical protein